MYRRKKRKGVRTLLHEFASQECPVPGGARGRLAGFRKAAERYPNDPAPFYFDLALALLLVGGNEGEAVDLIQARLDAHEHPNDLEDMLRQYEKALGLSPTCPPWRRLRRCSDSGGLRPRANDTPTKTGA